MLRLVDEYSPYLSSILASPGFTPSANPDADFDALLSDIAAMRAKDTAGLMASLRIAKKRASAVAAIADLEGRWDDTDVMERLSAFADACVKKSLQHLLLQAHAEKKIKLKDAKDPEKDCGVTVIALGKWGACELNYSSDIDLMVVFDPQKSSVKDADETQNFFIRLTRDLARILDAPTEDGYVFRTDLRLRPDPGAMPLAVSIGTAEIYYGSLGQNWERAAMIKARPMAGDARVGRDFSAIMQSWIWRRNLDFAAIQDIHSIKRQINARQKHSGKSWQGFNVKLGHGGIREIEFFAQTQQLIFGGRQPELRTPRTLDALAALAGAEHITAKTAKDLSDAYLFLRRVEHRLQMVDDRQTHSIPDNTAGLKSIAGFCGYASPEKLEADLKRHTDTVKKLYAELFVGEQSLSEEGNLVFTGVEDDPETIVTLNEMGFAEPSKVTAAIRGWHHGRYRAMRSEKARQMLTELAPKLLRAFAATPHPDDAFIRFDAFLAKLPSGVPIFSMFSRNPQQMALVADVMGTSPALAEYLGTHPQVLDGVLTRDFFGRLPDVDTLKNELGVILKAARDYQDVLDATRRWAREKRFHAGIHILQNISSAEAPARYLSDIAEAALCCLMPYVEEDFARQHGKIKGGEMMIIGMGSFAARRMYFDSDLDIVGIYDAPADAQSNGAKRLPASVYYIRLMQRVISALEAPTAEGILYKTDTRLRPSGSDGPLAVSLDGYFEYQKKSAWVWEHMSLIRSRPVCASREAAKTFEREKTSVLAKRKGEKNLKKEILSMRDKVDKEFGSKDPWNLKYARGGIMDIMFALHCLMLDNGLHEADLAAGLKLLAGKKIIAKKDAATLETALAMAEAAQGFLRLASELPFRPALASDGFKTALARHVFPKEKPSFPACARAVEKSRKAAFAVYKDIMKP